MRALLSELGEPERAFPAIHVVGTNGKSTATRRAAAFLEREGLRTGAYTSPHVSGWSERIQVGLEDAGPEQALERVRPAAERLGATQFEVLTAAALSEFAVAGVDVAVVEAEDVGRAAAEAFLGHGLEGDVDASLPGRLDLVGEDVYAGAHNPAGVEWLLARLPRRDYMVVASILADKDAEAMLRSLSRA